MKQTNASNIAAKIFLLVLAYVVTGRLAMLLAIPPGFATAIFPPVGIGLAAVLLWGDAMLVGVLMGSTVLNLSISWSATGSFSWFSLLVAFGIAIGSSLHNAVAATLIRRFVGFPTTLSDEWTVTLFGLIGAPLACVVSATWGVTVLYLVGVVSASQYAFSWWTWWVGDGMGVLIATPFMFVFFAKPRDIWSRRRKTVALPLLIGCAVMVATFFRASRIEQEGIAARFNERGKLMQTLIQSHFDDCNDIVILEERFMTAAPQSGRIEFSTFASQVRAAHPELLATTWVLRVRNDERDDYEKRMRADGFSDFTIRQLDDDNQLLKAHMRDEYMVVTYAEPLEKNVMAIGLDLLSEETRHHALAWARDHGTPAQTAPIQLVQNSNVTNGLLLVHPVYTKTPANEIERREQIRGFISGVIDPKVLVDVALSKHSRDDYHVQVHDVTDPNRVHQLLGPTDEAIAALGHSPFLFRQSWVFGGRTLRLSIMPTQAFIQANRSLQAWVVLAGGLFLCGLLGAFLLLVSGRTGHVEQLVEQRTLELSSVLDNATDAIVTFNADGYIERANPATAKLFDQPHTKLLERRITDLLPQIDWHSKPDDDTLQEVRGYRRDGSSLTLEMTLSYMDVHGRRLFTAMLHDITARKEAERLKNEFVSTVSHELRTPLTSISGSLGLIAGGVVGEISPEVRELVDIAKINVDRLSLLVNDILDIDKLAAGKLDVVCEVTDLCAIVQQSLAQNRGYADRFGISIVVDENRFAHTSAMVNVDASRILQVLANLLSNAVKFSPNAGSVEVSLVVENDRATVSVRDHGPGIPDEFRGRIFEKFAQADGADTRARGGTGLGLSISKAIIERFGGKIGFESTIGEGSTFYFSLPLARPMN